MKEFLIIAISLLMFFAAGVQLDFGDDVELPEWVEDLISGDKGSMIDMTTAPVFKIVKILMTTFYGEPALPLAG